MTYDLQRAARDMVETRFPLAEWLAEVHRSRHWQHRHGHDHADVADAETEKRCQAGLA